MKSFNEVVNNEIDLTIKIGNRVHNITENVNVELNLVEGSIGLDDLFKRKNRTTFIDRVESGELVSMTGEKIFIKDKSIWTQLKSDLLAAKDETDIPHFAKTGGLIKKALGVTAGNIDKIANGMSTHTGKNPSGEDWESVIACAVNRIKGHKDWMKGPEWARAQKFWGDWEDQAMLLGHDFIKILRVNKLTQLGASTLPISQEWMDAGATNKTPKTDLIDNGNTNISLKKAGGSQLLSAGKNETIATVQAAMGMFTESPSGQKVVNSLLTDIESKMITLQEKGTIDSLNKLAAQDPKTLSKKDLDRIAEMEEGQINAKYLTDKLQDMFNNSSDMKKFFCWEAATGSVKFKDSPDAIADVIATFKESGTLQSTLALDSPNKAGSALASGNSFYVSFKTGGGKSKPYLALRSKKISLKNSYADDTFRSIIMEEMSKEGLLTEEMVQLDEFAILKSLGNKIKAQAKKVLDAIVGRLKSAFKWIKEQGAKMWSAILNFFDLKIQSVSISSGGRFPL